MATSHHAPGHGEDLERLSLALALPRHIIGIVVIMPFFRRHSNGFEVAIDRHLIEGGWVICCLIDKETIGLRASTLDEAKDLADSLAIASHVTECDDACNDWELLKREKHA